LKPEEGKILGFQDGSPDWFEVEVFRELTVEFNFKLKITLLRIIN
jgi:hypothetical protein